MRQTIYFHTGGPSVRNLDKEASEFLRYLLVGAANAVAGLVLYFILLRGLNVNYVLANFLAFTLWSWFGFQLQRIYAFRASRLNLGFVKFLTNHLLFFLSSSLLLITLVELIGFSPEISYLLVLGVSSFGIYVASKLFVFSDKRKKSG
jgi:putative flippase GtrA